MNPSIGAEFPKAGTSMPCWEAELRALETFFPGILHELRTSGAVVLDDGDLSRVYSSFGGHVMPRSGRGRTFDPTLDSSYQASRPFLEFHVRRRLAMLPGVTVKGGLDVAALVATGRPPVGSPGCGSPSVRGGAGA